MKINEVNSILSIASDECEVVKVSNDNEKELLKKLARIYSDEYILIMWGREEYNFFRNKLTEYSLFMNFKRLFFVNALSDDFINNTLPINSESGIINLKDMYKVIKKTCDNERFEKYHLYLHYCSLDNSERFHMYNCRFLLKSKKRCKHYLTKKEAFSMGLTECHYCIPHKKIREPNCTLEDAIAKKETKRELHSLVQDYNRYVPSCLKAQYSYYYGQDMVKLIINGKTIDNITLDNACEVVKGHFSKIPAADKGRGYIDNKMSVNAQVAHFRGLKPKSYFTHSVLNELGFHYSVSFFHWLIKSHYLLPKEMHHTSASKNLTKFYDINKVKFIINSYNLNLLYDIYRKRITDGQAKIIRGIKYVKIQIPQYILTGNSYDTIEINCVLCDDVIFYTPKLCFSAHDKRIKVLECYDNRPSNFSNNNLKKIASLLVRHKTNLYSKYIKNSKNMKI
jgi:hypothetical protein